MTRGDPLPVASARGLFLPHGHPAGARLAVASGGSGGAAGPVGRSGAGTARRRYRPPDAALSEAARLAARAGAAGGLLSHSLYGGAGGGSAPSLRTNLVVSVPGWAPGTAAFGDACRSLGDIGVRPPCFGVSLGGATELHWRVPPAPSSALHGGAGDLRLRGDAAAELRASVLDGLSLASHPASDRADGLHLYPRGGASVLWPGELALGWPDLRSVAGAPPAALRASDPVPAIAWWADVARDLEELALRRRRVPPTPSAPRPPLPGAVAGSAVWVHALALAWSLPPGLPRWRRRVRLFARDHAGLGASAADALVGGLAESLGARGAGPAVLPFLSREGIVRRLGVSDAEARALGLSALCPPGERRAVQRASRERLRRRVGGAVSRAEWIASRDASRASGAKAALEALSAFPDAPLHELLRMSGLSQRSFLRELAARGLSLSRLRRRARVRRIQALRALNPRAGISELAREAGYSVHKAARLLASA